MLMEKLKNPASSADVDTQADGQSKLPEGDGSTNVPEYCQVLRFQGADGQVKEMIFPKALDLDRPKRPRTTFSENQLSILEREFQRCQYLIGRDRTRLADTLGLTETQIKVWFQNRRTKSKREKPLFSTGQKHESTEQFTEFSINSLTSDVTRSTTIKKPRPESPPPETGSAKLQEDISPTFTNTSPTSNLANQANNPMANFATAAGVLCGSGGIGEVGLKPYLAPMVSAPNPIFPSQAGFMYPYAPYFPLSWLPKQ